jgi:methylisocitrate lyase
MASLVPATPVRAAARLRQLLKDPQKLIVCPGVYDGLTARIALSLGFDALYMVESTSCPFMERTDLKAMLDRSWHVHVEVRHGRSRSGNVE